jgi:hypothetical protein
MEGAGIPVKLWAYIREVLGSNLSRDPIFLGFPQSLAAKYRDNTAIK